MENLFNSARELMSPQMIFNLSNILNEKEENIISATNSTIASIFELILEKGVSKKLELIFKSVGSSGILINVSDIFEDEDNLRRQKIYFKVIQYLLGNKSTDFQSHIAQSAGISEESAQKVIKVISILVAAFLGEKLVAGIKINNLSEQLEDERTDFQYYIPLEITQLIDEKKMKPLIVQRMWATLFL